MSEHPTDTPLHLGGYLVTVSVEVEADTHIGIVYEPHLPATAALVQFSTDKAYVVIEWSGPDAVRRLRALATDVLALTEDPDRLRAIADHPSAQPARTPYLQAVRDDC